MPYVVAQPILDKNIRCCWYNEVFSEDECEKIIELFSTKDMVPAKISGDEVVESVRKSKVSWHDWNQENDWVFKKLHDTVQDANLVRWQFNLSAFSEPLQFTKYEGNGGHYDYHQDNGLNAISVRKLSIVVILTDPSTHEGGALELFQHDPIPVKRGTIIIFPSFEMHRVTPVTKGERYSLVSWVSGPPYK